MINKKLAIVTCGNTDYFNKEPFAPIKAMTSFKNVFGETADYFCLTSGGDKKTDNLINKNGFQRIYSDETHHFNKVHSGYGGGGYPSECCYLFLIPSLLASMGYDYSLYVDGDVYCNTRFDIPSALESTKNRGLSVLKI